MKRKFISIPYSVELSKEDAWESLDNKKTEFFIVRCHFQLNERIINETHKVGEALAVYQSPKGVGQQHMISSTFEIENMLTVKSISQHLTESEQLHEFVGSLIQKAKLPQTLSLEVNVRYKLSEKFRESFILTEEVSEHCKIRSKVEFSITNTIDESVTESVVAVPVYKRKAYDIYLAYVDYLKVQYKRNMFGLRKKCRKYPIIHDFRKHPNKAKIGIPIATVYYWMFLPKSSKLMLEKEHRVEVEDAEQIEFRPPENTKSKYVAFPSVPSLYQIASAAFPLKWVWRQSEAKEWTVDDLKKIEMDEVRGNRGWWKVNR